MLTKCLAEEWDPLPGYVLDMTLNCIWWWSTSSGALQSVEYLIVAITLRSTQTQSSSIDEFNRSVMKTISIRQE